MSDVGSYREVLNRIANWNECSTQFRIDYGSNGERDYYRNLAGSALVDIPAESEEDKKPSFAQFIKDYDEILQSQRDLVRQLDVLINGEEGAAKQASLCDIVTQLRCENIFVVSSDKLKEFTTSFFYWWHNQPGTNTQQGFDEWFRDSEVKKILSVR